MTATIDQVLAAALRLADAPILFAAPGGRFAGPGPCVLLVHPTGEKHIGTWTLPTAVTDVGQSADPIPFGNALIERCGAQFKPKLCGEFDEFTWQLIDWVEDFRNTIEPVAFALIKQLAAQGASRSKQSGVKMESRAQFSAAQAKAELIYHQFGDSAPGPLDGERLLDYRVRLASPYQKHSKPYKDCNLSRVGDPVAMTAVENQIFADAAAALSDPATFRPGELRAIVSPDASGRPITRYVGHAGACWDRFNQGVRHVTRLAKT